MWCLRFSFLVGEGSESRRGDVMWCGVSVNVMMWMMHVSNEEGQSNAIQSNSVQWAQDQLN